jgi:hypothetical protein
MLVEAKKTGQVEVAEDEIKELGLGNLSYLR